MIQSALAGLNTASNGVAKSAERIAANAPETDLATEIVNLSLSKTAFMANVKVLEAASEMDQALLHTFDEKV